MKNQGIVRVHCKLRFNIFITETDKMFIAQYCNLKKTCLADTLP